MEAIEEELRIELRKLTDQLRSKDGEIKRLVENLGAVEGDVTAKAEELELLHHRLQLATDELQAKQKEKSKLESEIKKIAARPQREKQPKEIANDMMTKVLRMLDQRLDSSQRAMGHSDKSSFANEMMNGSNGMNGDATKSRSKIVPELNAPSEKLGGSAVYPVKRNALGPGGQIQNVEVEFDQAKVLFTIGISTTFEDLIDEAARYYGIDRDDCYFTDASGGVWPAEGVIQFELGKLAKIPTLIMALKPVVTGGATLDTMDDDASEAEEKAEDDEPSPEEIRRARYRKLYTDPPRRKLFMELGWFILFLSMFIAVSQARRSTIDINTVITSLNTAFVSNQFGYFDESTYDSISSESDVWNWLQGPLTENLLEVDRVMTYGKVVGAIELKQYRITNHTCGLKSTIKYDGQLDFDGYFVDACFSTFSGKNHDKTPFGPSAGNWTGCKVHQSTNPHTQPRKSCIPGEYCSGSTNFCTTCPDSELLYPDCQCPRDRADELYPDCLCPIRGQKYPCGHWGENRQFCCFDGFMLRPKQAGDLGVSITGDYGTYPVAAHKIAMNPNLQAFQDTIASLQQNNWVDRQTRAIVVQFLVFNPNYRTYSVCRFMFEFIPSGLVVPFPAYLSVISLEIFEWTSNFLLFILEIIMWVFMARFATSCVFGEMLLVWRGYRRLWPYFKNMWNWIDIFILLVIGITYLFRSLFFIDKNRRMFNPFIVVYTDLSTAVYFYQLAFQIDAVAVLLMFFKMFKYFSLNQKMGVLWKTLVRSVQMLYGFIFLYFLLLMAFVLMANIIFGPQIEGFSTISSSMTTLLLFLMGDFDYDSLYQADIYWAPILFIFYTVLMFLILLNVFVSILSEAYATESVNLDIEVKGKRKLARRTAGEIYRFAVLAVKDRQARSKIEKIKKRRKKEKQAELEVSRENRKQELIKQKKEERERKEKQKNSEEKKLQQDQAKLDFQKSLADKAAARDIKGDGDDGTTKSKTA